MRLILLLAGPVMYATSCSSPEAPAEQGVVVFRFDRGTPAARMAHAGGVSDVFDSVAVSVFRAGTPVAREVKAGAAITVDPVELTLPCIAEQNKRVSVDLFASGVMLYHGVNEDVDVRTGQETAVVVDAYPFFIPSLTVTPGVVYDGASFDLSWASTSGARGYRVQASHAPDFADIEWQQSIPDTMTTATLAPGTHYFRVAPETPYATGNFAGPELRYVLGGSGALVVTGLSAVGVIPGDEFSVYGENLDFPGTFALMGVDTLEVLSSSWGELEVRLPLAARTNYVTATSSLGTDTSSDPLLANRIAYVSATGQLAGNFLETLWNHGDDIEWSGMAYIPLPELDTRDMSVFDVIVVAHDTGTDIGNWGGNKPTRAIAITTSGANVLAIGGGGSVFMRLAASAFAGLTVRTTSATSVYASSPNANIFTTPHKVTTSGLPQWVDTCQKPEQVFAFDIGSLNKPAGVSLYASSQVQNDRWILCDALLVDATRTRRYLFWGLNADPRGFTGEGQDCLSNAVYQLYRERGAVPPASALR